MTTREKFLRDWYEDMKAADPHQFAEHDEQDGYDFPTTYGEYTYEIFESCPFVQSFCRVATRRGWIG